MTDTEEGAQAPVVPLLTLRDGLTDVVDSAESLQQVVERIEGATGPVAIDAERASGYRYSQRAYLIQLRREGAGTALIDPIPLGPLDNLNEAFGDAEWILHAASQDLACLREVGLTPRRLFDTELAARLLGYPRVGLATLVEVVLGQSMRKEHSAVDWSERPLPTPWLEYAALDVEVLIELRDILYAELVEQEKLAWAQEEFQHLIDHRPPPRLDPWRRTSGIHKVKNRRSQAAIRELWTRRDQIAQERDTTPGRLIPDAAVIAAALALPTDRKQLLDTSGFHGRGARRFASDWVAAIQRAIDLPEESLPKPPPRTDTPPQLRVWLDRDPVAAARLITAKGLLNDFCEARKLPMENLLTPDYLRRVLWKPPATKGEVEQAVADALHTMGARSWQIAITAPMIAEAIENPAPLPQKAAPDDSA